MSSHSAKAIATQRDPANISHADFIIMVSVPDDADKVEQLWVKRVDKQPADGLGPREFVICCIPFFTYGIALGDTVRTDAEHYVCEVVKKAGHRNLRVAVADPSRAREFHIPLHDKIVGSGLLTEWLSPGYVAVDLPPGTPEDELVAWLEKRKVQGEIEYEIDA
jgi:hypothetical protein